MTRRIVVACLLCALTLFCGCLEGPTGPQGEKGDTVLVKEEPSILGMWRPTNLNYRGYDFVLRADGSYYDPYLNMDKGTYEIEGNTIIFSRLNNDGTLDSVYTYEFILVNNLLSLKSMNDDDYYGYYYDYIRVTESIKT